MRRVALGALGVITVLVAVACDDRRSPGPVRGPSFEDTAEPVPPTPAPLQPGGWLMAESGTGADCGLSPAAGLVYLAGERSEYQLSNDGLVMAGLWDGTNLALAAGARTVFRPAIDCALVEAQSLDLHRGTSTTLRGTFTQTRERAEGEDCSHALPGVELPCQRVRQIELTWNSSRPAPHTDPYHPEPVPPTPRGSVPGFVPAPIDLAQPTSAPDLLRAAATPTPVVEEATPTPKPTPKSKGRPKKKKR